MAQVNLSSPFMVSDTEPVIDTGELVARDWGAEDVGSSTITSMSLLLSSAGIDPASSSLLIEICMEGQCWGKDWALFCVYEYCSIIQNCICSP